MQQDEAAKAAEKESLEDERKDGECHVMEAKESFSRRRMNCVKCFGQVR